MPTQNYEHVRMIMTQSGYNEHNFCTVVASPRRSIGALARRTGYWLSMASLIARGLSAPTSLRR
jgi:hypothetical protein